MLRTFAFSICRLSAGSVFFNIGHSTFKKTISVWLIPHFLSEPINNDEAAYKAIDEMIIVTKSGGEIIINPVMRKPGEKILNYFESLKQKGVIDYSITYLEPV